VLAQTLVPDEIIVVDDALAQRTIRPVVRTGRGALHLSGNKRVKRRSVRGLHESHADLIAFLDGDDRWPAESRL